MSWSPDVRRHARDLYVHQYTPLSQVAQVLKVPLGTIRLWKKRSLEAGDDWEKARMGSMLAGQSKVVIQDVAMEGFMRQYDVVMEYMNRLPPPQDFEDIKQRQDVLSKLACAFTQVVGSYRKTRPQISRLGVALDVLKRLGDFVRREFPEQAGPMARLLDPFAKYLQKEYAGEPE